MANAAFRAKSRFRLPWLIKCLLCGLDCAMIRRLCGSFLMTGENSLENTLRPPFISPFPLPLPTPALLGGQFSSLTVQVYTNLSTHSLQKSTLLSFEQSLQCHLVPGMGLTPQPSHCEVENIHCYKIYHSHSPTKNEHISKFPSRGYQLCYTSS